MYRNDDVSISAWDAILGNVEEMEKEASAEDVLNYIEQLKEELVKEADYEEVESPFPALDYVLELTKEAGIGDVIKDTGKVVKDFSRAAAKRTVEGTKAVGRFVGKSGRAVKDVSQAAARHTVEGTKAVGRYVKKHPVVTSGIGAGTAGAIGTYEVLKHRKQKTASAEDVISYIEAVKDELYKEAGVREIGTAVRDAIKGSGKYIRDASGNIFKIVKDSSGKAKAVAVNSAKAVKDFSQSATRHTVEGAKATGRFIKEHPKSIGAGVGTAAAAGGTYAYLRNRKKQAADLDAISYALQTGEITADEAQALLQEQGLL